MNKVQLTDSQIKLAQTWLPNGSYPYTYDPVKGRVWFWQPHHSGVAVKNALKLDSNQLQQLNQLN